MSQRRALIIGSSGQDGSYLSELLLSKRYEVHGFERSHAEERNAREVTGMIRHFGDLSDSNSIIRAVQEVQPNEVYNLGAQSQVNLSFSVPEHTADITGLGVTRLLETLHRIGNDARFYQASSSELFGDTPISPQNEMTPFSPRNPYACAKAYGFYITRNYRESYGMFAVNGILYNHESPRRDESFVTRKITMSLARIVAGQQDCLYLGDVEAKRDWGYAKEFVEGMWLMLQQENPDDYVLATGHRHSVREFLEFCLDRAGLQWKKSGEGDDEIYTDAKGKVIVRIDPTLKRSSVAKESFIGDPSKAKKVLGWQAKTTLKQLADIMMSSDLERVGIRA
jgi:GDPmannose 4,6-dehydratase